MYWTPDKIWKDKCVFIIGGGPSLRGFKFERLRNRSILAINEAYVDVPFADILFFRDYKWYDRVRPCFSGIIVSTDCRAIDDPFVKVVEIGTKDIPKARTSGHSAVALAMMMGAIEIVLLGFDWNLEGGNYHDRHVTRGLLYGSTSSWDLYEKMAGERGVIITNGTIDSRINQFPRESYKNLYLL